MALAGRSRADNEVTGTVIGISGGGGGRGGSRTLWYSETVAELLMEDNVV